MGKCEELKEFPEKQFKRLTGTQRETFEKMIALRLSLGIHHMDRF